MKRPFKICTIYIIGLKSTARGLRPTDYDFPAVTDAGHKESFASAAVDVLGSFPNLRS